MNSSYIAGDAIYALSLNASRSVTRRVRRNVSCAPTTAFTMMRRRFSRKNSLTSSRDWDTVRRQRPGRRHAPGARPQSAAGSTRAEQPHPLAGEPGERAVERNRAARPRTLRIEQRDAVGEIAAAYLRSRTAGGSLVGQRLSRPLRGRSPQRSLSGVGRPAGLGGGPLKRATMHVLTDADGGRKFLFSFPLADLGRMRDPPSSSP
jgi:hypothetical protein